MPEANDLIVGIMALVAQAEREVISRRTREALAEAKARGVKLGNPNGAAALRRAGRAVRRSGRSYPPLLTTFAQAPVLGERRDRGISSLRGIATELNARAPT
ncbi:MAG: recombinase family protein [Paracoccaceae bacterium]